MEQEQRRLVKKYIDLVLRRKKIIISFLFISIVVGLGFYLRSPKVYQCMALIKYQRQRINPTQMSPDDIRSRTREVVATVSQQITSRTSLEAMIKEFDLYPEQRMALPMEDVVDVMRDKHIDISPDRGDIFRVSYQGSDPKKVLRITNALAAKFIEENLRYREERASETSAYVQDELSMAKESIDKKEAVMRDYKLKYYNEMPDQRQTNMNRLNSLQGQLQSNQDSMQDLERTKILIQEQITLRKDMLAQAARQFSSADSNVIDSQLLSAQGELEGMRVRLKELLTRYTAKHPEVRRLKKQIKKMEEEQNPEVDPADAGSETPGQADGQARNRHGDPQLEQMMMQLKDVQIQIKRLRKNRNKINSQIEQYKQWIEATPIREAEWAALTRDYEQLHNHYQLLVARNIEAESAENLEKRQKGSQFKIIDPAHFPEKPFKPDFKKIMMMAVGLGLGLGGGIAFALDVFDTSFKEPEDLENYLGLSLGCAIPLISTPQELKRQKIITYLWSVAFLVAGLAICGLLIYSWRKGMIVL